MNLFMPWWNIFLAGIIAGYFSKLSSIKTFFTVLFALSVYWIILIVKIDASNESILSAKVLEMIHISNREIFVISNGLIGGLCGAFGSQIGINLRSIVNKIRNKDVPPEDMNTDDYKETQPE